jgi:short-subunit dehydrogenase
MYTLITGASRGIGAAFARRLAADGHPLILVARDGAQLATLKEELEHHYAVPIEVWIADLSHPGSAEALHAHCQQSGWVVSQLINNAGFGRFGDFLSQPAAIYAAMLQLNAITPVLLAHYFLADMRQQRRGTLINVASMAAFQPTPYLAVYGATKAFLLSFSEALAGECKGTSIRILTVCPGATATDFFRAAGRGPAEQLEAAPPMQSAEELVELTLQALRGGQRLLVPGWKNRLMTVLASHLPRGLALSLSTRVLRRQFGPADDQSP